MSHRPNLFAPYSPTCVVRPLDGPFSAVPYGALPLQLACLPFNSEPKENGVVVPARQANSHWASVGSANRYFCCRNTAGICPPCLSVNFSQNVVASLQSTISTGKRLVS